MIAALESFSTFGQLLRFLRSRERLTQRALGLATDFSEAQISRLEHGLRPPDPATILARFVPALRLDDDQAAAARLHALAGAARGLGTPGMRAAASRSFGTRSGDGDAGAPPCNLPAQPTPLIGRDREVAALRQQLLRRDVRLLTLTGTAGIGKTRLAIAVAAASLNKFPGGVVFIDLAPISNPRLVVSTIAAALGIRDFGAAPPLDGVATALRGRRALLVLDNFEQVLPAAATVAQLLRTCPEPKFLVTSRAPLRLRWERLCSVPPLALPDGARRLSLGALAHTAAVALFIDRARAANPDFRFTPETAPPIVEICAHLDGLALAIELAAVRTRFLPPSALLAQLGHRLRVLTTGCRDLPERQRTLRAAIDWSYDLLSAPEQAVFRRLAVFVGGFEMGAAEAVCDLGDLPMVVLDLLGTLADQCLLQIEQAGRSTGGPSSVAAGPEASPGREAGGETPSRRRDILVPPARLRMLETIREYAMEQLLASGELDTIRWRHGTYYLALAEDAERTFVGQEKARWLERLRLEHGNVRAALEWLEATGAVEERMRLASALHECWYLLGHAREGYGWLRRALANGPGASTAARAKALHAAGTLAICVGEHPDAVRTLEEAVALRRKLEDKPGLAESLYRLGLARHQRNEHDAAQTLYEEALAIWREGGHQGGIALIMQRLGALAQEQGDHHRAGTCYAEAAALWRAAGDQLSLTIALDGLAGIAQERGDHNRAVALYEQGLALRQAFGDQLGAAISHDYLATLAGEEGDVERAIALLEEGLACKRQWGDKAQIAFTLYNLCLATYQLGQRERACDLALEALGLERDLANLGDLARRLEGLAEAVGVRAPEGAARLVGAAETLRESLGMAPRNPTHYGRIVSCLTRAVGADAFVSAKLAGRAMSPEEAVAYALAEPAAAPAAGAARPGPTAG